MATDPKDRPSTPRQEYVDCAPDLALIRNLLAGTRRMHEAHKEYIPKWPAEKAASYKRRATSAKVYGGLSRTLSAAVGMLFAKPPELSESWSADMLAHWENIDGKGTKGTVFAKRRAEDAIADGFTGILVDHPAPPPGVQVHAGNEAALNLRPMWAHYARADVLSWRTAVVDNAEKLTQVVLREGSDMPMGEFGTATRVIYRVCQLVTAIDAAAGGQEPVRLAIWRTLEEVKGQDGQVTVHEIARGVFRDRKGQPFDEIPFAVPYAGRTDAILCAHPPLLDVAWANLEHWRKANNLQYYEDMCAFPQPTVIGELARDANGLEKPFQLGPWVYVHLAAGGTFQFTEVTGASLAALRASLDASKDEIAELGVSFLSKKTRGVETAEAKRLDASAENSTLATSAQGIEDGLNEALRFHARYLGIEAAAAPTIEINRDFENLNMEPATMAVYVQAVKDAGLPPRLLLHAWQQGGRIPAEADLDEIEAEMMANAEAERARAEADAAAQASAGLGLQQPAA